MAQVQQRLPKLKKLDGILLVTNDREDEEWNYQNYGSTSGYGPTTAADIGPGLWLPPLCVAFS